MDLWIGEQLHRRYIALVCKTHDPREPPGFAGFPPHVQKLERPTLGSPIFLMAETMRSYLNRSVVLDRVDTFTTAGDAPDAIGLAPAL